MPLHNRKLPKSSMQIPGDPNNLPFFTVAHMFAKKVECLAVRHKPTDREDLVYLWDHFTSELHGEKIKKMVTAAQRDAALHNHKSDPRVLEILNSLEVE